jgi:hypothetical protein
VSGSQRKDPETTENHKKEESRELTQPLKNLKSVNKLQILYSKTPLL